MFSWLKKPKGYKDDIDASDGDNAEYEKQSAEHSEEENKFLAKIEADFQNSQAVKGSSVDETGYSIEDNWEDEYYIYKGGGLQWLTNFAYRNKKARQSRPNSEDNFVFNALTIQHANITANIPEVTISGVGEDDDEISQKLTFMSRFNDERNGFRKTWKKWVYDFIGAGPTIAMVTWDSNWMGGKGPNRWVGDVKVERVDKWDMYFDPAISDLEDRMQDCSFIIRRPRKKLHYIKTLWPERGKAVGEVLSESSFMDEGSHPEQAYVIEYWHRGFPHFMPEERRTALLEKAAQIEQEGDYYRARDYYDAAKGELEGVHVAYVADGVLLEYSPYEYEDGMYPFVFTTRFFDEKCPWGFGEIRNIKIPQIMHNKADEVEIEAMSKEGLGGGYFQKGTINPRQLDNILTNSGRGGTWFEVDSVGFMKERTGVKVPASITNYKEHKQRMIETLSQITPIQQGMSPSSNMPFKAIQELGARTDIRIKQAGEKLEDFLRGINRLRINRMAQFYDEERYYRVKGSDGKTKEGTLKAQELYQEWPRDAVAVDQTDPSTGEVYQQQVVQNEKFIPEFDVKVSIISEKPTDRNYYTSLAMELYGMQLLTPEDLLSTLEEGKLPPMDDVLQHVYSQNAVLSMVNQVQAMPPELQQIAMQTIQQTLQEFVASIQMQQGGVPNGQGGQSPQSQPLYPSQG